MAEQHDHHHDIGDPEGLNPKELASMRWQANQGFASARVSPTARLLGILLICKMDPKTRACFPGEARLAAELGVHLSAIKKAKAELREAGLLDWYNPGGPRHLSHYSFGWAALLRLSREASERGKRAVNAGFSKRRQSPRTGTNGAQVNGTHTGTIEDEIALAKVPKTRSQSTQIEAQGTRGGPPIVPVGVPDITLDISLLDISHVITPSQGDGGHDDTTIDKYRFRSPERLQAEAEAKRALEGKRQRPICHYPSLVRDFKDEPEVIDAISRLGFDQQTTASSYLATKGADAAREFILRKAP